MGRITEAKLRYEIPNLPILECSLSSIMEQIANSKPEANVLVNCPGCLKPFKTKAGNTNKRDLRSYEDAHKVHGKGRSFLVTIDGRRWEPQNQDYSISREEPKPPPTEGFSEAAPAPDAESPEPNSEVVQDPLPAVEKREDRVESEEPELAAGPETDDHVEDEKPEEEAEAETADDQETSPPQPSGPQITASPQAEDGHIDMANETAEALAKINLSAYESRVLWALWRKTYGWHKKADMISITQFQKITELKRQHVSRTISELLKRNIVTRIGDSRISTYGFQKDYTKWKSVTKRGDYAVIARVSGEVKKRTVTRIGDRSSPKRVTTKETIQKKIYVEGDEPLRAASLLLTEIQKNKPDFKTPNLQMWARDLDLMIRRDGRSPERIEKVIAWAQRDSFWRSNILSPGSLRRQFDRLELAMQGSKTQPPAPRKEQSPVRDLTGTGQAEVIE